jgi:hypothetical protein
MNDNFQALAEKWPSSVVARKAIPRFSGGAISSKLMANEDCNGTGVQGRFSICNRVVYPLAGPDGLVQWLRNRSIKSAPAASK